MHPGAAYSDSDTEDEETAATYAAAAAEAILPPKDRGRRVHPGPVDHFGRDNTLDEEKDAAATAPRPSVRARHVHLAAVYQGSGTEDDSVSDFEDATATASAANNEEGIVGYDERGATAKGRLRRKGACGEVVGLL